ncbi:ACN9-domain-containing protein [Fomitopsis serialis]|uniref:ACN9-domain-containing protein n=1 Tax=Fomitopsis serialis TaxID=139415 RepID=UPI0020076A05|nr:ACN9-domain-containing protein [Neoantrodia serialis]KAH9917028.1 ACN9-domain-containing protein [Neoantrodia serialis]
MRATLVQLAKSVSESPLSWRGASATLLPPIPLYRRILRAHCHLPREMRSLGDDYVKAEFRRHKEITNKVHIFGFLTQWKIYLDGLPSGKDAERFSGKKLDPTLLEKMSAEQLGQLYELMDATKAVWNARAQDENDGMEHPKSSS